jgi:hypothetical protein
VERAEERQHVSEHAGIGLGQLVLAVPQHGAAVHGQLGSTVRGERERACVCMCVILCVWERKREMGKGLASLTLLLAPPDPHTPVSNLIRAPPSPRDLTCSSRSRKHSWRQLRGSCWEAAPASASRSAVASSRCMALGSRRMVPV